jgi:hypothetical protein
MGTVYAVSYLLGYPNLIAGAIAGTFFFIGREHTQAEYRWIALFGKGLRANMPWYGGFDPRVWNHLDSWLDWLAPTLVVTGLVGAIKFGLGW